jgi:uncharacterized protein YndB with AHSA1/START domain
MNQRSVLDVRVTRRFGAPPGQVFDAWLDPKMIGRWMFGPNVRDEEVVMIAVDGGVGGSFSFVVRREGEEVDHVGQYLEIDRPRRLAFTWGVPRYSSDIANVRVDIVPLMAGCELTVTHELHPDWADFEERTQAGWNRMLGVLAAVLDGSLPHG